MRRGHLPVTASNFYWLLSCTVSRSLSMVAMNGCHDGIHTNKQTDNQKA